MKGKILVISLLVTFSLFSTATIADLKLPESYVTVWVEASLGININGSTEVTCYRGEECGTWLEVENTANIRDEIKLKANLDPSDVKHILYDFECAETVGICDNKMVRNMILTPTIGSTRVYLSIMPLASKNVISSESPKIEISGYSQTNKTYEKLHNVIIKMKTKSSIWKPLEAPGLEITSIILLFICSVTIFATLRNKVQ